MIGVVWHIDAFRLREHEEGEHSSRRDAEAETPSAHVYGVFGTPRSRLHLFNLRRGKPHAFFDLESRPYVLIQHQRSCVIRWVILFISCWTRTRGLYDRHDWLASWISVVNAGMHLGYGNLLKELL